MSLPWNTCTRCYRRAFYGYGIKISDNDPLDAGQTIVATLHPATGGLASTESFWTGERGYVSAAEFVGRKIYRTGAQAHGPRTPATRRHGGGAAVVNVHRKPGIRSRSAPAGETEMQSSGDGGRRSGRMRPMTAAAAAADTRSAECAKIGGYAEFVVRLSLLLLLSITPAIRFRVPDVTIPSV